MEDNANVDDGPIVGYRQPKNKVLLNYRKSALNTKGLRVMRMLSKSSDIISPQADKIKMMIICIYEEMCKVTDDDSSVALSWFLNCNNNIYKISDLSEDGSVIDIDLSSKINVILKSKAKLKITTMKIW